MFDSEGQLQGEFNQACADDRHDIIDSMLFDGYIPTAESMSIACWRGDQTLVLKLFQYPDLDVQPGFMEAVGNNQLHLLDHLYTRIDVNKPGRNGDTALHVAGSIGVIQWLLDMGARQTPSDHGDTPLHYACCDGHMEIVKLLLQHMDIHGQVQTPNIYGATPLHRACWAGNMEIVKLLLSRMDIHGQVQTPNNDGDTPLHHACWRGHTEIVKLLLSHMDTHGQVQTRNNKGELPIDIARYTAIVQLLEQ